MDEIPLAKKLLLYTNLLAYSSLLQCDERRPRCANCAKRQSECQYASEAPIIWTNQDVNRSRASSTPASDCQEEDKRISTGDPFLFFGRLSMDSSAVHSTPDLNLLDLELMMQWCNSTYRTLSREERTDHTWQVIVPQEALSHPFLMHGILAISALHLARIGSETHRAMYISSAISHQNQALALFRGLLGDINSSNGKAMFIFSSMVTVFAFGFPHTPDAAEPLAPIDDLYQVLVLCNGMVQILLTAHSWIRDSDMAPILHANNDGFTPSPSDDAKLSDDARRALQQLREINDIYAERDPGHDPVACRTAIDNIGVMLVKLESGLTMPNIAVRWIVRCRDKYLEFLRARTPLALVILSHYCVILHRVRHHWWLAGWSTRVLKAIWLSLGNEWRHYLSWAMLEVFGPGRFGDSESV